MPFCVKEELTELAEDFLQKKIGTSKTCSDVVTLWGVEPQFEP